MSLGGVFVVAFTPPSPDFCWCVWVTRSTCRAVVDSSHLIPQLLFFISAHALSCWTPDKMADKSGSPGALGWSSENSQFSQRNRPTVIGLAQWNSQ